MTIVYAVGKNLVGYLPEGSTYYTTDYDSARRALIEDLDRAGDFWFDGSDDDKALADEASAAMEDANLASGPQDFYIGYLHFWCIAERPDSFGFVDDDTLEEQIDQANDSY